MPIFIISLFVGLFFVYIIGVETKPVYVYPTPENINNFLYKDKAGNCFQMVEQVTECPSDISNIQEIPMQE